MAAYDHRWATVAYGLVSAGITRLCIGFAASHPLEIALGGGLLVATGVIVVANLPVTSILMLAAWSRSACQLARDHNLATT
jgi:hypothetical protein